MSVFATDKPVAAVRLEGTLCDGDQEPIPGALDRLRELRDEWFVVVVSPLTHTDQGTRIVFDWLIRNDVPYDELWCSPGIPPADTWIDNEAATL
jgi:hypothetical protein